MQRTLWTQTLICQSKSKGFCPLNYNTVYCKPFKKASDCIPSPSVIPYFPPTATFCTQNFKEYVYTSQQAPPIKSPMFFACNTLCKVVRHSFYSSLSSPWNSTTHFLVSAFGKNDCCENEHINLPKIAEYIIKKGTYFYCRFYDQLTSSTIVFNDKAKTNIWQPRISLEIRIHADFWVCRCNEFVITTKQLCTQTIAKCHEADKNMLAMVHIKTATNK